ncbi:MAG: hypothetical protein N3E52_05295 [Candidatus Bathyarchaeota archaeon]|nr:hypothetical protein [Candidatus Bathyarchaeota archaeon]
MDTSKVVLTIGEQGMRSEQIVQKTRLEFIRLFNTHVAYVELSATILGKYDYVEDGITHIVLHLDNATYPWVEATPKTLSPTEWNALLAAACASKVELQLEKRDDRWIITQFKNVG